MPVLSEHRYTVDLTAREARAAEIALRYWLGGDDVTEALGNGDHAMCAEVRQVVEALAAIRRAEDTRVRLRERFKEIMKINPRLPSRQARAMAAKEIGV